MSLARGKLIKVSEPETDADKAAMFEFMKQTRGASLEEVWSTKTKYWLPWHPTTKYRVRR